LTSWGVFTPTKAY